TQQQQQQLQALLQAAQQQVQAAAVQQVNPAHHFRLAPTKPDTFNGHRSTPADVWLVNLERYFLAASGGAALSDEFKINFATAQLRESAATWWTQYQQQHPQGNPPWTMFKDEFLKHFLPVASKESARAYLHKIKQRASVPGYCDDFNRHVILLGPTDMTEADKLFLFKQGLNAALAQMLIIRDPKTLQEAQLMAVKMAAENPQLQKAHFDPNKKNFKHNNYYRSYNTSQGTGATLTTAMELG